MARVAPLPAAALDRLLTAAVQALPGGATPAAVRAALPRGQRPARDVVADRLRALAAQGTIHRWSARPERFGPGPLAERVRDQVLALFEDDPRGRKPAEVSRAVLPAGRPLVPRVLADLVREGRIHEHSPRSGRVSAYGGRPADAADYLSPDLDKLIAKIARKGFSPGAVQAAIARRLTTVAPPSADTPRDSLSVVVDAMAALNPKVREGALVYVPHLRQFVTGALSEKAAFDRALLALLARGVVELQAHPVPSQLTPDEREALVADGRGGFYVAAGLTRG